MVRLFICPRTSKNRVVSHIYLLFQHKENRFMSKPEITVTCFFADEGDVARQILFRSFVFYLQRELTQDGRKLAFPAPVHV